MVENMPQGGPYAGPPEYYRPEEKTETKGSSGATAVAVGAGAVVGAILIGVAAPVILPIVGAGALLGLAVPAVGAAIGGWIGWAGFGKK